MLVSRQRHKDYPYIALGSRLLHEVHVRNARSERARSATSVGAPRQHHSARWREDTLEIRTTTLVALQLSFEGCLSSEEGNLVGVEIGGHHQGTFTVTSLQVYDGITPYGRVLLILERVETPVETWLRFVALQLNDCAGGLALDDDGKKSAERICSHAIRSSALSGGDAVLQALAACCAAAQLVDGPPPLRRLAQNFEVDLADLETLLERFVAPFLPDPRVVKWKQKVLKAIDEGLVRLGCCDDKNRTLARKLWHGVVVGTQPKGGRTATHAAAICYEVCSRLGRCPTKAEFAKGFGISASSMSGAHRRFEEWF